ncbi:MAG: hypothetical protein EHM42_01430, partial [Planctomycetaceae bacterium]
YVMISGGPKGSRPTQCLVADKYPWHRVAPGLSVAIKGQVLSLDSKAIPTLAQAVIVSVDESQAAALRYSADELCRQFADDPAAAEKRYSETWGWVAGTIESLDNVNGMLYLDGPGNAQVGCGTVSEEKVWDSSLKPGMSVVIMGQLMKGSRRGLAVRNCLPPEVRGDAHAGVAPREEAESGQPVTAP